MSRKSKTTSPARAQSGEKLTDKRHDLLPAASAQPVGPTVELNHTKLNEELRSLRQQRLLALLGAFAAVVSFPILNADKIRSVFQREPSFHFNIESPLVERVGKIRIYDITIMPPKIVWSSNASDAKKTNPLPAGSYRADVTLGDSVIFNQEFVLRSGDERTFVLPTENVGTIRIVVRNDTPNPRPGEALNISIDTSGNGYLWVLNLGDDQEYHLIYPSSGVSEPSHHWVAVGTQFRFPDSDGIGLSANDSRGKERLLFVVTSTNDASLAQAIANRVAPTNRQKAAAKKVEQTWGLVEIEYEVK